MTCRRRKLELLFLLLLRAGRGADASFSVAREHYRLLRLLHGPQPRRTGRRPATQLNTWPPPEPAGTAAAADPFLGTLRKISTGGDDSFLGENAVPTFAASGGFNLAGAIPKVGARGGRRKTLGLEGVLGHGPSFVVRDVLSKQTCDRMIETLDEHFGTYNAGKNRHGALQLIVPQSIADALGAVLSRHVDTDDISDRHLELLYGSLSQRGRQLQSSMKEDYQFIYAGLNRRWRVYRYAPGGRETFAPHIDAGFPPSGLSEDGSTLVWDVTGGEGKGNGDAAEAEEDSSNEIVSRLTVLFYLNDDFVGGETNFYKPVAEAADHPADPPLIAAVQPVAGSALVFPQAVGEDAVEYARTHWPLHEGSPVQSGSNRPKYVVRSDILFVTEKTPRSDDPRYKYDHLVRSTFLPASPSMDRRFLSHVSSLYNPHMGVENMGPFLYSFLRFTKMKNVVEIGAGYTSAWILQALKDNDDEMSRIKSLQDRGECLLFDWPWTVPPKVSSFADTSASLLCIDNCLHQKETATGAMAVARTLGLDSYMRFVRGDAFELQLDPHSVDVLWCDFGVGDRIADFLRGAWPAVRPGGFLLCHSTLTNRRTRNWLECVRRRMPEDVTGMPPDGYVELSLLEPHKHHQNSVSIFQKRSSGGGGTDEEGGNPPFREPVYSEYA